MEPRQLVASVLVLVFVAGVATALIFGRGRVRRPGRYALYLAAAVSLVIWFRFFTFHTLFVDAVDGDTRPNRPKLAQNVPFHFHELFHYYLGAKYFRELGYLGLYDCTAFADREAADADGVPPRVRGYVRDLNDVLLDKPLEAALASCRDVVRPRFSDARWASFTGDLRELRRLAPDDWWQGAVYDAGFNPPPSWSLWGSAVANLIPIRAGGFLSALVATTLDLLLLVVCFFALRRAFGRTVASLAVIFFGASFIASYTWNGGAFLRYTWLTSLILGLCFQKLGRPLTAGLFLGASICDRIFPLGFAVGALAPIAYQALGSPAQRQVLTRILLGMAASIAGLVLLSTIVFGVDAWLTFFDRILRHGDIHYVGHIGLKKVLTFRDWVPNQDFWWHEGLQRFHAWNVRLHDTWRAMWFIAIPLQLVGFGGALAAALRRRPEEGALLVGVAFMFLFNLPANYYYVILALVPALLYRRAVSAPTAAAQLKEYGLFVAFLLYWTLTLVATQVWPDEIIANFVCCTVLLVFLALWIAAWLDVGWLRAEVRKRLGAPTPVAT